ncbi:hypothetical protein A7982_13529 [Minicystis rosea]|nr:hypothetical protein A7982_13529 [Minicystis rosea]
MTTTARMGFALLLPAVLSLAACEGPAGKPEPPKAEATKSAAGERGFVSVKLASSAGDLPAALKAEAAKAKAMGLKPYVEFWASWCGPCMAIKKNLDEPRMKAAFKGAYIIELNADEWSNKLSGTGMSAGVIPIFYQLDDEGKATGKKIDGGAWGDNIPANMAPPLDKFFHGT